MIWNSIHQINVKSAYLNGKLTDDEKVYMRPAPGYPPPGFKSNQVLKLVKTLYGLKQSGRRWYQHLVWILCNNLGYSQCDVDQAVFFKRNDGELTVIVVHVKDCTIALTSLKEIVALKKGMGRFVEVTDLGELHWILGIEVKHNRELRELYLSQHSYLDTILRWYNFDDLKPVSIPMDPNIKLSSSQCPSTAAEVARMCDVLYIKAVGSLMWAMLGTRPDIAFAVQTVSRFSQNPGLAHWEAVKRIYRYLKGTRDLWLRYGGKEKKLEGYVDADGSMAEDRHAITGYAFLLNGGTVSWASKRQEIVSLSTTESEYVAATHGTKEAMWLRSLIAQVFSPIKDATTVYSDNQSAIALSQDHQYYARTKHIDVRFHFIRWVISEGTIQLVYCPTNAMVADALTKVLPSAKVKHFANELGLFLA